MYVVSMHTHQDWLDIEENPGLLHVSVHEGHIWLSDDALHDLEEYTGRRPASDNARDVLEFLDTESAKLRGATFSQGAQEMNFMGFCLMKGLRHAIEVKMFGKEHVEELPDMYTLQASFLAETPVPQGITLH